MKTNLWEARFHSGSVECLLRVTVHFYIITTIEYIQYYTDISEEMLFVQRIRKAIE